MSSNNTGTKKMNLRYILVLLLALSNGASAQGNVIFIDSPYFSVSKSRKILDAADLKVFMPMKYEPTDRKGTISLRADVIESRLYKKNRGSNTIEIALLKNIAGGFEFAITGTGVQKRVIENVASDFRSLLDGIKDSRTVPEISYEMFRLGNIAADRAVALLKALGYHTIEFEAVSSKVESYEKIFKLIEGKKVKLPYVIKVANASKTSLLRSDPYAGRSSSKSSGGMAAALGGSHLHSTTTGSPEERLLLVYDQNDPEPLEKLINLLRSEIDLPAQQIVIEALVIEVNTKNLRDLGVDFQGARKDGSVSFEAGETGQGKTVLNFSRDGFTDFIDFSGKLEALQETGNAEVLSSPSVLVLNDRQARIQVGRQIPVAKTTATTSSVSKGIDYFPVGIVLNLRPRINRDATEVTMQIETIISSISVESAARLEQGSSGIEFSPIIDNRIVETFVRVADGTPFIIGGLLSTDHQSTRAVVPFLGDLPLLGRLFSRERVETEQREVIVVITPHVVPIEGSSFSYLIPKDSDLFDRFDTKLFRNAYRVRDTDVWDLKFLQESPVLVDMVSRVRRVAADDVMMQRQEPFSGILSGRVPGEEVLVKRMLSEIVSNLDFGREVNLDQVFFFSPPNSENRGTSYSDDLTLGDILPAALDDENRVATLTFEADPKPKSGQAFSLPIAVVGDTSLSVESHDNLLWDMNKYDQFGEAEQWAIVLANEDDVDRLRQALVLKRVLELNKNLALTMQGFRPGVQILFPSREDIRSRWHAIDREVARLFFENRFPYQIAERVFNETVRQVNSGIGGR